MTLAAYATAGAGFATVESGAFHVAKASIGNAESTSALSGIIQAPFAGAAGGTAVFAAREGVKHLRVMPKPVQAACLTVAGMCMYRASK